MVRHNRLEIASDPLPAMGRRRFMSGAAAITKFGTTSTSGDTSLREIAAMNNIAFGTEATLADLAISDYADLVARECSLLTPGLEAKWEAIEPDEEHFRFGPMDAMCEFARSANLRLHMHNLIWSVGLPAWTLRALSEGRGRAILANHISKVASRYLTNTDSWDVVNEAADPRWPSGPEGLCNTPWRHNLGPDFVGMAFTAAHAAAPSARLLINDGYLEYDLPGHEQKRMIYLRLIESWLKHGVAIHGFGLEAHLRPWLPLADQAFRAFLHDLAGFGLKIYVTELDVCDRTLPPQIWARDAGVAHITKQYLDLVLDEPAVCAVITWGLSDRSTWMARDPAARRDDGLPPRPLPYDAQLRPKPMRAALASAFRGARQRPA